MWFWAGMLRHAENRLWFLRKAYLEAGVMPFKRIRHIIVVTIAEKRQWFVQYRSGE